MTDPKDLTENLPKDINDAHRRAAGGLTVDALMAAASPLPFEEPSGDPGRTAERAPKLRSVGDFAEAAMDRMDLRRAGHERPIPLPWPKLAAALGGGLWPGLYTLTGGTGSGKSQMAMQLALHAARNKVPVLYVGLELGERDLVARLVGLLQGRRWSQYYLGREQIPRAEASKVLSDLPLYLEVGPPMGWSYTRLLERARQLRELHPPQPRNALPMLIVVDFLQLIASPPGVHEDLRERIGRASYAGRAVARDLDAAVLMVSSTARENYGMIGGDAEGKGPKLGEGNPGRLVGSGKESGEIEYSADGVLVLTTEPWKSGKPPEDGTRCWLALAKGRAVMPTWIPMLFDGNRFLEPIISWNSSLNQVGPSSIPRAARPGAPEDSDDI